MLFRLLLARCTAEKMAAAPSGGGDGSAPFPVAVAIPVATEIKRSRAPGLGLSLDEDSPSDTDAVTVDKPPVRRAKVAFGPMPDLKSSSFKRKHDPPPPGGGGGGFVTPESKAMATTPLFREPKASGSRYNRVECAAIGDSLYPQRLVVTQYRVDHRAYEKLNARIPLKDRIANIGDKKDHHPIARELVFVRESESEGIMTATSRAAFNGKSNAYVFSVWNGSAKTDRMRFAGVCQVSPVINGYEAVSITVGVSGNYMIKHLGRDIIHKGDILYWDAEPHTVKISGPDPHSEPREEARVQERGISPTKIRFSVDALDKSLTVVTPFMTMGHARAFVADHFATSGAWDKADDTDHYPASSLISIAEAAYSSLEVKLNGIRTPMHHPVRRLAIWAVMSAVFHAYSHVVTVRVRSKVKTESDILVKLLGWAKDKSGEFIRSCPGSARSVFLDAFDTLQTRLDTSITTVSTSINDNDDLLATLFLIPQYIDEQIFAACNDIREWVLRFCIGYALSAAVVGGNLDINLQPIAG